MRRKFHVLVLSALAVTGLAVVSAPAAQAGGYSQVGYASKNGRQVYLWRNNDTGCLHAQGRSMRAGDRVFLLASMGGNTEGYANAEGVVVDTPERCTKHGTDYNGWVDPVGSVVDGPMTQTYRNF